MDWNRNERDTVTLQGDLYKEDAGERVQAVTYTQPFSRIGDANALLSGGNIMGRWKRIVGEGNDIQLQVYYDRTNRHEPNFGEIRNTFDVDFLQRVRLPARQQVSWGLGARVDPVNNIEVVSGLTFVPNKRTDYLLTAFVQDEIGLVDRRLSLILGTKLLRTNFTTGGVELEPSARLLWTPTEKQTFWAAFTHALRTPSDAEENFNLSGYITATADGTPFFARFNANPNFVSEQLNGYEAGYRRLLGPKLYVDVAGFYNHYHDLFSEDLLELGVLVDRFNEMLAGIQSRDKNLRTALHEREQALRDAESARERFHFMAESMPQKIFTATPSGEVDYFNRQWTDFTGLSFEQIKDWGWTQFIHPDDVDANVRTWRHSIDTGEPFHFQHRFRRADGEYRWHLSRAHSMRDAQGKISMWIGSNTDIHEQKEKEEELRRANDDLQQFAYSASHDLQEPIRNVAVYSEVVAKRYHNLLDADGQQFLGFLTEGGRRLATLINDLLAYTRAGVVEQNTTSVDSSAVLERTLASLAEAIRESGATVTCGALPVVQMGEAHLQQVFQNLIGNALKYRQQDAPRIHVSAIQQGSAWRFSVQDNGIGIDSQYKEKIFGVFKRLHRDQKYDGTGIGLAICQRVVKRYGGRIWVESEPGKGATFFFTVPQLASRVRPATVDSSVG